MIICGCVENKKTKTHPNTKFLAKFNGTKILWSFAVALLRRFMYNFPLKKWVEIGVLKYWAWYYLLFREQVSCNRERDVFPLKLLFSQIFLFFWFAFFFEAWNFRSICTLKICFCLCTLTRIELSDLMTISYEFFLFLAQGASIYALSAKWPLGKI